MIGNHRKTGFSSMGVLGSITYIVCAGAATWLVVAVTFYLADGAAEAMGLDGIRPILKSFWFAAPSLVISAIFYFPGEDYPPWRYIGIAGLVGYPVIAIWIYLTTY